MRQTEVNIPVGKNRKPVKKKVVYKIISSPRAVAQDQSKSK